MASAKEVLGIAVVPSRIDVGSRILKLVLGVLSQPDALDQPLKLVKAFRVGQHVSFAKLDGPLSALRADRSHSDLHWDFLLNRRRPMV